MITSRARAGHARHMRAGYASRALAVVATATGGVYTLTDAVELAPGSTKEYWIRFSVTRNPAAAGYSEANLACSVDGNNELAPGKGLFNEVLAQNGKDWDGTRNNKACGPTVPHDFVVLKAGTQNTGSTLADASNQYIGPNNAAMYPLKGTEFAIYKSNPNTDANKWAKSAVQAFSSEASDMTGPRASWSAAPARPPSLSRTPRLASCPRPAAPESTPTAASQRRSCPGRW